MLTKKQRELLIYIHEHMSDGDIAPSFDEMKDALELRSKSGIHRLITGLVERGYLERLPHKARALRVIKIPEGYKKQNAAAVAPSPASMNDNMCHLPLCGKIAAGTPIEAIQQDGPTLPIPMDYLGSGEYYALTIEGDSMIKAGIHDGDTVIIEQCDNARNGEIVVALVDEESATLKRFRKAGNKVILEPENDDYEPQMLDPSRVRIQGRLSSLLRRYH